MDLYVNGQVIYISVSGYIQNSAQLEFTIQGNKKGDRTTILVTSDYEPQVFSSMADILTSAYYARGPVSVGYHPLDKGNFAFEVKLPILKKGKGKKI